MSDILKPQMNADTHGWVKLKTTEYTESFLTFSVYSVVQKLGIVGKSV